MSGNTSWLRRRMGTAVGSSGKCGVAEHEGGAGPGRRSPPPQAGGLPAGRSVPAVATFTVTSTADSAPANNPTTGTLRWAVEQADAAHGGQPPSIST